MLNWVRCFLSVNHEYGMWCEPGAIFLRCVHCGRRSSGWALSAHSHEHSAGKSLPNAAAHVAPGAARVLPFSRAVS